MNKMEKKIKEHLSTRSKEDLIDMIYKIKKNILIEDYCDKYEKLFKKNKKTKEESENMKNLEEIITKDFNIEILKERRKIDFIISK